MKIRKHFTWAVVIGMLLIVFQIILDINSYNNCLSYYELCTENFSIEQCRCNFLSAIGINNDLTLFNMHSFWQFIGHNTLLILGILLIIFEKKQKKKTLSKKEKIESENKEDNANDNDNDNDNKFMWE